MRTGASIGWWALCVAAGVLGATELAGCGGSSDASGPSGGGDGGVSVDGAASDGAGGDAAQGAPPAVTIRRAGSDALNDGPQYLSVRKSATELPDASQEARCKALLPEIANLPFLGNKDTCTIFNPYVLSTLKDADSRRTFFAAGFHEAQKVVGHDAVGGRRLAVEVSLDLLNAPVATLEQYLDAILDGARVAKVPLLVNLDAVDWWDGRPDLWNFFDPQKPGYDPKNVANVEWVGATGDTAPHAYWRNWGSQIRVGTPVPDLGSPTLRAEIKNVLGALLPKLVAFEEGLAPDQRYLYAGAIVGTELAIGVNHYYYPNGNSYLSGDPKCDPGLPFAAGCPTPPAGPCASYNHSVCPPDFTQSTSGGMAQLGFHAEKDLSLGTGTPARAELDGIVTNYLAFMRQTIVDLGLPQTKVFSHTGGTFGANGPQSYGAAYTRGIFPGWSMYYAGAQNPASSAGTYVDSSDTTKALPWASPEWLPFDPSGSDSQASWFGAIEDSLNYRNNRMISIANWEGVAPNPRAIAAIGQSMSAPRADACTVAHREAIGEAHFSDASAVRFSADVAGTTTYLNVSSTSATTPMGTLANVDVTNSVLGAGELVRVFPTSGAKKVWIQIATDGCVRNGAAQRMLSQIYELDVGGGSDPIAKSNVHLFGDHGRQIATLTWDGAQATALTIDFSRTPDFATVESATFKDARAFYSDGWNAAFPLYARVHDGAALSNVVELK